MPASKKDLDKPSVKHSGNNDSIEISKFSIAEIECPRCGSLFTCNAVDIKQCQCWGVGLKKDDFTYLKRQGFSAEQTGCLCRDCLLQIQKEVADIAGSAKNL